MKIINAVEASQHHSLYNFLKIELESLPYETLDHAEADLRERFSEPDYMVYRGGSHVALIDTRCYSESDRVFMVKNVSAAPSTLIDFRR